MQRRILIIDDYDDLASATEEIFVGLGHTVDIVDNREEALKIEDIEDYDLVITDLDVGRPSKRFSKNGSQPVCLPKVEAVPAADHIRAFKICAANYRREQFDENELRELIATVLDYKARFVDRTDVVQDLHENIEFELPSVISLMHIVLEYLLKRVEKLGVIKSEQSNLFVALDEAFVNAVKHGNKYDTGKLIRVTAEVAKEEARFTIEDEGEGFDVHNIPDPLDPDNLFKPSGRGVLFIYNIMDEVKYNERGNRLTMIKRSEVGRDTEERAKL